MGGTGQHCLRHWATTSASVTAKLSRLNIPPHTIAVYASRPPSPADHATLATGRLLALPGPDFHPTGSDQLILTHPHLLDGLMSRSRTAALMPSGVDALPDLSAQLAPLAPPLREVLPPLGFSQVSPMEVLLSPRI